MAILLFGAFVSAIVLQPWKSSVPNLGWGEPDSLCHVWMNWITDLHSYPLEVGRGGSHPIFICPSFSFSLLFLLQWTTNQEIERCRWGGCKSKGSSVGLTVIFTSRHLRPQLSLVNQGENGLTPFFPTQVRQKRDCCSHAKIFPPHPCDVKHKVAHFSYFLDRGNNFLICPEGARAKKQEEKKRRACGIDWRRDASCSN